jgi:hypothetical protein
MLTHPFQHYGLDWVAMLLTFIAIYALGNKQRHGFLIMIAGNCCWIILGFKFESLGMILANVIFFVMNTRGFIRWGKTNAPA